MLIGWNIDEQHVVIVADPAIGAVHRRQAIAVRIVDPVLLVVEHIRQAEPDREAAIAIAPAIGRIIALVPEQTPVAVAIALPVIALIAPPVVVIGPKEVIEPAKSDNVLFVASVTAPRMLAEAKRLVVVPVVKLALKPLVTRSRTVKLSVALPRSNVSEFVGLVNSVYSNE